MTTSQLAPWVAAEVRAEMARNNVTAAALAYGALALLVIGIALSLAGLGGRTKSTFSGDAEEAPHP